VVIQDIRIKPTIIAQVIKQYTRESGVRELDRRMAGIMRGTAKKVAMEEDYNVAVKSEDLYGLLGPVRYSNERYTEPHIPGVTVGLAWTQVGGDILFVEASLSPGKGKLTLTGNLGDVMKESATTALSYLTWFGCQNV